MKLRFALAALALSLASLAVAQDTVQLFSGRTLIGKLNELDGRYLTLKEREVDRDLKLLLRDSISLVRYDDDRLYVFSEGRPTRVTRQEIAPPTRLSVRQRLFADEYLDGELEIPKQAFDYKLRAAPQLRREFRSARSLQTFGKVLAVPAGFMLGLTVAVVADRFRRVNPPFAIATGAAVGTTLIFSKLGAVKQARVLDRINAGF